MTRSRVKLAPSGGLEPGGAVKLEDDFGDNLLKYRGIKIFVRRGVTM